MESHDNIVKAISSLRLPRLEPFAYDGNPLLYHQFMFEFDTVIAQYTTSPAERLIYLCQYLVGEPKEVVASCMFLDGETGYTEARRLLEKYYGDPMKVMMCLVDELLSLPTVGDEDYDGLRRFSMVLNKCKRAMEKVPNLANELDGTSFLQKMVCKFSPSLHDKWIEFLFDLRRDGGSVVYSDLCYFIENESDAANDPVFGIQALQRHVSDHDSSSTTHEACVRSDQESFEIVTCVYCSGLHDLDSCDSFVQLCVEDRRRFVYAKRLCFACYGVGHISKQCSNRRMCRVCHKRHPTALHVNKVSCIGVQTEVPKSADVQTEPRDHLESSADGQVAASSLNGGDVCVKRVISQQDVRGGFLYKVFEYLSLLVNLVVMAICVFASKASWHWMSPAILCSSCVIFMCHVLQVCSVDHMCTPGNVFAMLWCFMNV